jgi:hypothetical protein
MNTVIWGLGGPGCRADAANRFVHRLINGMAVDQAVVDRLLALLAVTRRELPLVQARLQIVSSRPRVLRLDHGDELEVRRVPGQAGRFRVELTLGGPG